MKCEHSTCTCQASAGQRFCSDACRQAQSASQAQGSSCSCGHADCAGRTAQSPQR
jgi:hypothetical protein